MLQILPDSDITYIFIDPRGMEEKGRGTGVTRDVYSSFWFEVSDSCLIGEQERVPFVRHDLSTSFTVITGSVSEFSYHDVVCVYCYTQREIMVSTAYELNLYTIRLKKIF